MADRGQLLDMSSMLSSLRNPAVVLLVTLVAGLLAFGGGLHHETSSFSGGNEIATSGCWVCLALSAQTIDIESTQVASHNPGDVHRDIEPSSAPRAELVTRPPQRAPPIR